MGRDLIVLVCFVASRYLTVVWGSSFIHTSMTGTSEVWKTMMQFLFFSPMMRKRGNTVCCSCSCLLFCFYPFVALLFLFAQ